MTRPGLADQGHLLQWADTVPSSGDFPRLIRRLILETGQGVLRIGLAAGRGTSSGGWDGTVHAAEGTTFVPAGLSVWELSVGKDVTDKPNKDFDKRLTTPDGTDTADCTYIEVILRRWTKRDDWAAEKVKVKRWSTVRAYGVDAVETWLESAPITHAWLSDRLGLGTYGVVAAETWWEGWSQETSPALMPSVPLAGRDDAVSGLRARLSDSPQITSIKADSYEDVLAFVAAFAQEEAENDGGLILSRTAFVDDVASWRALQNHKNILILVPRGDATRSEVQPGSSHQVIVPVIGSAGADIILSPLDASRVVLALKDSRLEDRRAQEAGRLGRRSLKAMRRRLATKPELDQPQWAHSPVQRVVRRILLAGRWNNQASGDREVVEKLVGLGGEDLRDQIDVLTADGDPFVSRVDQSVGVVSPVDAWILLRGALREDDLERFGEAAMSVLLFPNPALELAPQERWQAAILGKANSHSRDVRTGIATSLALLGLHGEYVPLSGGANGVNWVNHFVRELLEKANEDGSCHLWASLEDQLPLLAEAAPDSFLNAVREGVKGDMPLLQRLFLTKEESAGFGAHSPHTGLLWAMERLAWSADHFGATVDLLARLAELDPDPESRFVNRPLNSLVDIFYPPMPDTSASPQQRIDVLEIMRTRYSDIAWKLLLKLLPDSYGMHALGGGPVIREWMPDDRPCPDPSYGVIVEQVAEWVVTDAGVDVQRWRDLVKNLPRVPVARRTDAINGLRLLADSASLDAAERCELWEQLRSESARHRRFSDALWALPSAEVDALEEAGQRFQPGGSGEVHAWLFNDHMPDLGDPSLREDFARYESILEERRRAAVVEINSMNGLDGLRDLVKSVSLPWDVGASIADAGLTAVDDEMLHLAEQGSESQKAASHGYLSRRAVQSGWAWIDDVRSRAGRTPFGHAYLLLISRDLPKSWEEAASAGDDVEREYWQWFEIRGLGGSFGDTVHCAGQLVRYGRAARALHLLSLYSKKNWPTSNTRIKLPRRWMRLSRAPNQIESAWVCRRLLVWFLMPRRAEI